MSENTGTAAPAPQVTEHTPNNSLSDALETQAIENESSKHLNANDIEIEESSQQVESEEKTDEFAPRFAALSRKEKNIRQRERALEQEVSEYRAWKAKQDAPKEEVQTEKELPLEFRLKKDPLGTLEQLGLTYEDLTKMVLNDGEMSADMQMKLMREEIERDYRSKYEEIENKLKLKEQQEAESKLSSAVEKFKSDINSLVDSSEEYELIQANDAYDLVYDVIEQYYEESTQESGEGKILSIEEAAAQVEQYLEEEAQKLFERSNKLKSRLTSASKPAAPTPRQSPTLSNSHAVTGNQNTSTDRMLSREESIAQLANQIKWND